MAEFCRGCSKDLNLPGVDLEGVTSQEEWDKGKAALVVCEGCGSIQVDPKGNCVSGDCFEAGRKGHGMPWKVIT